MTSTASTDNGSARTADGRRLTYFARGPADGFPVLFFHGTPGSRLSLHVDPEIYERAGVREIGFDRPGYGGSDPNPGRDVAAVVPDAAAVADELGVADFAVIGISGGGPHALATAAGLPERVVGAATLVTPVPPDDSEIEFLAGMAQINVDEFNAASEGREAIERYLAPYAEQIADDPDAALDALAAELPEPDQIAMKRPEVRKIVSESIREAVRQGVRGWADDDLAFARPWGFAPEDVRCEVRMWQGELDVLVPHAHGARLSRRIPNATFELVPNAGHSVYPQWATALEWLGSLGQRDD